jgi:hypothetical protein
LGENHRLRVFENRTLRRIFKRNEMTGEWRRLHNKELNDLYSTKYYSGDQIKKSEISRPVAWMG